MGEVREGMALLDADGVYVGRVVSADRYVEASCASGRRVWRVPPVLVARVVDDAVRLRVTLRSLGPLEAGRRRG
jgi:hypothetical protein